MKNKIIKTLTVGLGCLMLTLTVSTGVLNHNFTKVHVNEDMPLGMIQTKHIIHIDMDSPSL